MAKQNNIRSDTSQEHEQFKEQFKEQAPPTALTPPTDQQVKELLLILDKEKLLLSGLAKVEKDGKLKTVPADNRHNNEFLRINPTDYWLEVFAKNFWSQLKDPTKFGLIKLKESDLEDPLVKQAMQDISEGKITKAAAQFMEKYELKPQNINQQNSKEMAKQNQNQDRSAVEDSQPSKYRYNENMVDWDSLKDYGLSREYLEQKGFLDPMLKGYKTNELVPVNMNMGAASFRGDARLSFRQDNEGRVTLNVHALKQHPEFSKPFMGHNFSDEDKKNLLNLDPEKNTGNNMGRVAPLRSRSGEYVDSLISLDKMTNEIVAVPVSQAFIPDEVSGVKLTDQEKADLREGKAIFVDSMTSKAGNDFNAHVQYNAERRGIEYLFPKQLKMEYGQELGKVKLSNHQIDALNSGKAIFVEDMVAKSGNQFSSYIKRDEVSGKLAYTRNNPDNPGEIFVPKEISGVKVNPEEREQLREGRPIFLNDMTNSRGEDFSSWVKLDLQTGVPQYSKTMDGFDQRQEFKIPVEVFGVTLTAKQRADLQDGKAVMIEGMKGYGGKEFSQYAKVNQSGNKLNFFNDNPDAKRTQSQRSTQTATVKKAEEQKQDKKQDKKRGRSV